MRISVAEMRQSADVPILMEQSDVVKTGSKADIK